MLLRRLGSEKRNPMPPKAMVATGLLLLACSNIWPRFSVLHGTMSPSGVDFIQGVLLGIGLACEIMGIVGMARSRSNDKS